MPQVREGKNHPPAETCQMQQRELRAARFQKLSEQGTDRPAPRAALFFGSDQAHQGLQRQERDGVRRCPGIRQGV